MILLLNIGIFAFLGYHFMNPKCNINIQMKNGDAILCDRILYNDNTVHFKTCEGVKMVVPVNNIKEVTYQKIK